MLKILEHLLHEDSAGKGDGVPNGGDHQAVVLRRVLKPGQNLFQNWWKLSHKDKVGNLKHLEVGSTAALFSELLLFHILKPVAANSKLSTSK